MAILPSGSSSSNERSCSAPHPSPASPRPPGAARKQWPPPPILQGILLRARHRYRGSGVNLHCHSSALGIFTFSDMRTLALEGYWPLPPRAIIWLESDEDFKPSFSWEEVVALIRKTVAADLPEAISFLQGKGSCEQSNDHR